MSGIHRLTFNLRDGWQQPKLSGEAAGDAVDETLQLAINEMTEGDELQITLRWGVGADHPLYGVDVTGEIQSAR
jgi:hypothetical protein